MENFVQIIINNKAIVIAIGLSTLFIISRIFSSKGEKKTNKKVLNPEQFIKFELMEKNVLTEGENVLPVNFFNLLF
jgi:hypothetical protein